MGEGEKIREKIKKSQGPEGTEKVVSGTHGKMGKFNGGREKSSDRSGGSR